MPFKISANLLRYFKGFCSSAEIIMLFVYMKCRFSLSYRELEEMAIIRGVTIDRLCSGGYGYGVLRVELSYLDGKGIAKSIPKI